jgi:hypothetical protein
MHRVAPYYMSMFVLMAGFFTLIVSLLFGTDKNKQAKKKVLHNV